MPNRLHRSLLIVSVALSAVSPVSAQQYPSSVVGTDFDFITDSDPSCFQNLTFVEQGKREMPDKTGDRELFQEAFVFTATYLDFTEVEISIDADFESRKAAQTDAMRYATRLGKLPTALRKGVNRIVVHKGHEDTTAFSDIGLIVLYSDNATKRISTHDLEETLFHESVHAAWDSKYANSPEWRRAQTADNIFVTTYAKKKPALEDLAESALFAYVLTHHPERIPVADRRQLVKDIPARIDFVADLIPSDEPIFYDTRGKSK